MISWLLACTVAFAEPFDVDVGGHVKSFFVASFPYEHVLMPPDDFGTGVVDGRIKIEGRAGKFSFKAHHAVTGITPNGAFGLTNVGTGVAPSAPELVPLTWVGTDGTGLRVQGRTDWLYAKLSLRGFDLTIGRQPISFGHGMSFTPMDLVAPFFPTTIDTEYKPGVDSVRVDGYIGTARLTAVSAFTGESGPDAAIAAAYGQATVGVTDIGGFYGYVRGDHVVGATVASSIGAVGIHSDATLTRPVEGGPVFFRGTAGMVWRPFDTSTWTSEFYAQSNGAGNPSDYLGQYQGDRYTRGELWLAGRYYLATTWSQELSSLVTGTVSVVANLTDPSALLAPVVAWSVSDNADVIAGGYFGLGQQPDDLNAADLAAIGDLTDPANLALLGVNSEFGLTPHTAFVQVRTYF